MSKSLPATERQPQYATLLNEVCFRDSGPIDIPPDKTTTSH